MKVHAEWAKNSMEGELLIVNAITRANESSREMEDGGDVYAEGQTGSSKGSLSASVTKIWRRAGWLNACWLNGKERGSMSVAGDVRLVEAVNRARG